MAGNVGRNSQTIMVTPTDRNMFKMFDNKYVASNGSNTIMIKATTIGPESDQKSTHVKVSLTPSMNSALLRVKDHSVESFEQSQKTSLNGSMNTVKEQKHFLQKPYL